MKPLNTVISGMPRSGIRELMDLAWSTPGTIHLEVGQPDFDTPAHIVSAAAQAAADGYTRYTPNAGILEVREAFAAKATERNGIRAEAGNVIVTVGAINAIAQAVMVLCDPGDGLLIPDPGWPNYEMVSLVAGTRPIRYPLVASTGFAPDFEALEACAADPAAKAIIINSPTNPTGAVFDADTLGAMLEIAARYDLWVISDECYEDIVFEGPHLSPATLTDPARVVSIFSMSKTYAMTGWRVGYAVAPETVVTTMAKLTEALTSCVTGVAQKAAQAAVSGDQACVEEMRAAYQRRRDVAVGLLEDAGLLAAVPHGAFYVMADVSSHGGDGYDLCRRLVSDHGVATAPGETFGPGGAGFIRLSLAADDDSVATGTARIVAALTG